MRLYKSDFHDASLNEALEIFLYESAVNEPILFLYRNEPSVIIGRHQNPWKETDVAACQRKGITVCRRISGGGAVFHDCGNLNYAFFIPRNCFNRDEIIRDIARALAVLGIKAEIGGSYGLYVDGCKISGTSFAMNSHTCLMHGCILVNTNMRMLESTLTPVKGVLFTGGTVDSVRAEVRNLSDLSPKITIEAVEQALIQQAMMHFGNASLFGMCDILDNPLFYKARNQVQCEEWKLDRTPDFCMEFMSPYGYVTASVHKGRIEKLSGIVTDLIGCRPEQVLELGVMEVL